MHELMHSVTHVNLRALVRSLAPSLIVALLLCGSTMVGKIPVPGTPVPITLQTFVLMTAALTLGWRRATAGTVLYLGLGAAGMPVFSGGGSTLSLIGPSGGFLFGFVPSVILTAVLAGAANRAITSLRTKHDMNPALAGVARFIACFMACAFGFLIVGYGFGAAFQSTVTGMPLSVTATSTLVFVPGDLIKIAVASLLALPVLASADSAR